MSDVVRPAVRTDAAALHRVAARTFPLACTPHTPVEEVDAYIADQLAEMVFARHLVDPARILHVAVDGDTAELIGYSMLVTGAPEDTDVAHVLRHRPTIELSKMYVDPAHHGDGSAARLIEATLTAAAATGAAGVWLSVSEENARANAFYARYGFERVGRRRFAIGDRWEDDFVRERALSGPR